MKKLIFFLVLLIGTVLCAPRSFAHENAFQEEVLQMLTGGFIPLEEDNWLLWHGAGSKWKLTSSEGTPENFAKHMDAFLWQGSKLLFHSEFCQENNYGFQSFILSGHLDLSQAKNSHSRPSLILSKLPRGRGEAGCSQIKNGRKFQVAMSTFEYSRIGRGEVQLVFFDPEGYSFKLLYRRDHEAERLLQSRWKLTSDNLMSARKCGPLTIRPHGVGPQEFVEPSELYYDGAGWWPDNPDSPVVVSGCSDKNEQAELEIENKLKNGFNIYRPNRLFVDPQSNSPLVFEPAAILSDIEGKYKLTGLELKSYSSLF